MLMSALKRLLPAKGQTGSVAEITRAIDAIDAKLDETRNRLFDADRQRGEAVLNGPAAAERNREEIERARHEMAGLTSAREQAIEQLALAQTAEAEAERRRNYDAAERRHRDVLATLKTRLPAHIAEHIALIRVLEEARRQIEAANADLPAGFPALSDPESEIRDRPGRPSNTLSEKREVVWVRTDTHPGTRVDPDRVDDFRDIGPGVAEFREPYRGQRLGPGARTISEGNATYVIVPCTGYVEVCRKFEVAESGKYASRLHEVAMPGLRWFETGYIPPAFAAPTPDDVLVEVERAIEKSVEPEQGRSVRTETLSEPLPADWREIETIPSSPVRAAAASRAGSPIADDPSALPAPMKRGRQSAYVNASVPRLDGQNV